MCVGDDGDGNGERSVGRGVTRGRREIGKITWTKPENITSKRGKESLLSCSDYSLIINIV